MWSEKLVHLDFAAKLVEQLHGPTANFWVGYDDQDGDGTWVTSAGSIADNITDGHHVRWAVDPPTKQCASVQQTAGG